MPAIFPFNRPMPLGVQQRHQRDEVWYKLSVIHYPTKGDFTISLAIFSILISTCFYAITLFSALVAAYEGFWPFSLLFVAIGLVVFYKSFLYNLNKLTFKFTPQYLYCYEGFFQRKNQKQIALKEIKFIEQYQGINGNALLIRCGKNQSKDFFFVEGCSNHQQKFLVHALRIIVPALQNNQQLLYENIAQTLRLQDISEHLIDHE